MSKNRIAVYYKGGCGGHFLFYFLVASGEYRISYNIPKTNKIVEITKENINNIKKQFYLQFNKNKEWLKYELWPNNSPDSQLFLFCSPVNINKHPTTNIKICPYIKNPYDWFRTILYKKTAIFRDQDLKLSFVKSKYKDFIKSIDENFTLKVKNCDYYIEMTEFVNNLEEQKKLTNLLSIPYTPLMKEFVDHYNNCHADLKKKTSW